MFKKRKLKREIICAVVLVLTAYGLVNYVENCGKWSDNKIIKEYSKPHIWKPYYNNSTKSDQESIDAIINRWYLEEGVDLDYKLYKQRVKKKNPKLEGLIYLPDLNWDGKVGE